MSYSSDLAILLEQHPDKLEVKYGPDRKLDKHEKDLYYRVYTDTTGQDVIKVSQPLSKPLYTREMKTAIMKRWLEIKSNPATTREPEFNIGVYLSEAEQYSTLFHLIELGDKNAEKYYSLVNKKIIENTYLFDWLHMEFKGTHFSNERRRHLLFKYLADKLTSKFTEPEEGELKGLTIELLKKARKTIVYKEKSDLVEKNLDAFREFTSNPLHFDLVKDLDYFFLVFESFFSVETAGVEEEEGGEHLTEVEKAKLFAELDESNADRQKRLASRKAELEKFTQAKKNAEEAAKKAAEASRLAAEKVKSVGQGEKEEAEAASRAAEEALAVEAARAAAEEAERAAAEEAARVAAEADAAELAKRKAREEALTQKALQQTQNQKRNDLPKGEKHLVQKGDEFENIKMIETQVATRCGIHAIKNLLQRQINTEVLAENIKASRESQGNSLTERLNELLQSGEGDEQVIDRLLGFIDDTKRCPKEMLSTNEIILLLGILMSNDNKWLEAKLIGSDYLNSLKEIIEENRENFIGFIQNVSAKQHFVAWILKDGHWYEVNSRIEEDPNTPNTGTITKYTLEQFDQIFSDNTDELLAVYKIPSPTTGAGRITKNKSKRRYTSKKRTGKKSKKISY